MSAPLTSASPSAAADLLLLLIVLLGLSMVGTSRLLACVRMVALQGGLLALLPIFLGRHEGIYLGHTTFIVLATFALKVLVIPYLILRTLRETNVRREVEPFVSLHSSVLIGAALIGLAFYMASRLVLPRPAPAGLLVPAGLSTLFIGFLILVSRRKAVTQVVGYLVLENGVYIFSQLLAREMPTLVELVILLDVLVGVFVMGIAIYQINRTFDHIDTDVMTSLRD